MNFTYFLIATFCIIVLIIIYQVIFQKVFYFTSYHSETKNFDADPDDFQRRISNAMERSNFKHVKFDNSKFRASAPFSLRSWSEKIEVDYRKLNDNRVQVECTSTCYFPLQVFDWGKNKSNTSVFFKKLGNFTN